MRKLPVILFLLLFATPVLAQDADKKDKAVEPTHWGKVMGQVYDADTGAPVEGASVTAMVDGEFPAEGRALAKSNAAGKYQCEAMLGRVSSNVDVGRLLSTGLVGLIGGGATNVTKRVDITRVPLKVTKDGYRAFEGVVLCRSVDSESFRVTMEPILLAPTISPGVSCTAEGWGVACVSGVTVDPAVVRPGGKATVTARVASPPVLKLRDVQAMCFYTLDGKAQAKPMKARYSSDDGLITLTIDIVIGKNAKAQTTEARVVLYGCPYDIVRGGSIGTGLIQVAASDADDRVAAQRADAFGRLEADDNVGAANVLKAICALPEAQAWDYGKLAEASRAIHDTATSVGALKRYVELTPAKPADKHLAAAGRHAAGLVESGSGAQALAAYEHVIEGVKERDRPAKVPVPLMVAMGNAYLQEKRFDKADSISKALLKWPDAGKYQATGEFRNALRLAQAEAKLKDAPTNAAARADYGRVLMDLGRWDESVAELSSAAAADVTIPAIQRDLAYARLHMQGGEAAARPGLDAALASADQQTKVKDKSGKESETKSFNAWHTLGILLYAKGRQQEESGDSAAAQTYGRSREAMRKALKCGRTGADVEQGSYSYYFGYTSPRVTAISGFAYPEADSDFVILDSLKVLEKQPNNYIAHLTLGTALIDLDQCDLADRHIAKALSLQPDNLEAKYASALIALKNGDRDKGLVGLLDVSKANPRHPKAFLSLARLYTEDGDAAAAAACLAYHAKVYGKQRD